MSHRAWRSTRRTTGFTACVLAISLVAASCGGKSETSGTTPEGEERTLESLHLTAADGESGLADAGDPVRGGTLTYGIEAESSAGFCLSSAQLAISGMLVVRALYDTLTVPNSEGDYVPYLAKAITPNDAYDEWTIELREGIKFHDGTDLTGEVVKNNLDAYRGKYVMANGETKASLLFTFVLDNIDTVEATGPLTVKVTTKVPWVAFPAYLFSSSRMGMMAQSQLDDAEGCSDNPVGTGPFVFESWNRNQKLVANANPDYWQTAPDGKPYPYAASIEFRPIPDGQVRNNTIESGGINVMHTSNADDIANKLYELREDGKVNMTVSEEDAEVAFLQLNSSKPPFNDIRIRKALAMGADRSDINDRVNDGMPTLAEGPFGPGSMAYLEDTGFPEYDLAEAKKLVAEYVAEGHKAEFTLMATTDPTVQQLAELVRTRAAAAGVKVNISLVDQATLIDNAISRNYEAMTFRNYPGGDPDSGYVWWYGGAEPSPEGTATNPVNFGGFYDEEINRLLDEGRSEPDPAKRKQIYQDLNRRFGEQVYSVWSWFTPWAIVTGSNVHGVMGPPLPGDDPSKPGDATTDDAARQPALGLATAHSLLGLWIES